MWSYSESFRGFHFLSLGDLPARDFSVYIQGSGGGIFTIIFVHLQSAQITGSSPRHYYRATLISIRRDPTPEVTPDPINDPIHDGVPRKPCQHSDGKGCDIRCHQEGRKGSDQEGQEADPGRLMRADPRRDICPFRGLPLRQASDYAKQSAAFQGIDYRIPYPPVVLVLGPGRSGSGFKWIAFQSLRRGHGGNFKKDVSGIRFHIFRSLTELNWKPGNRTSLEESITL